MTVVLSRRSEDTFELGRRLGRAVGPGTVVALIGDLGTGKTVFAKGVGAGLEVPGRMASPTFIIVQTHEGGRLPLWHADLYRLGDASELDHLGLDELLDADGVTLIEWADRFAELLPADRLDVRLSDAAGGGRRIEFDAGGPRHAPLLEALGE